MTSSLLHLRSVPTSCRLPGITAYFLYHDITSYFLYLAVLHGVAEEAVQEQALQLRVSVEGLLDLPQKHTAKEHSLLVRVRAYYTRNGCSHIYWKKETF